MGESVIGANLSRLSAVRLVAVACGDLSDEDQKRLLDISHQLTDAFRLRLAELATPPKSMCSDPDTILIRNNRRVRAARPNSG
jgi:hypothetical protein